MKMNLVVQSITQTRESVVVHAEGHADSDSQYGPKRHWQFEVPTHAGRKYRIGQKIKVEITK